MGYSSLQVISLPEHLEATKIHGTCFYQNEGGGGGENRIVDQTI